MSTVLSPPTSSGFVTSSGRMRFAAVPLRTLPLLVVMSYLGTTLTLFLVWPINWPIYRAVQWVELTAYVLACFGMITWQFMVGSRAQGVRFQQFRWIGLVILAGAVATFALLFPSAFIYTGRWPWEIMTALGDQGEAYKALQYQLEATAGQRAPIAFARAIAAPLTFAVLPLGLIYWQRLTWGLRGAVAVAAGSSIVLSILRGTDRELSDLFIIGISAFAVSFARRAGARERLVALIRGYWKQAVGVLLFVAVAFTLSTERKSERLGGFEQRQMLCANTSQICADIDQPILRVIPLSQRFGLSFFILSTCSGYYGLHLSMEKDFRSTYGFGHSPAALTIYGLVTGDDTLDDRTYTARNALDGWSDENYWSTLIAWIANDVGFYGAVLVMGLIGFLWGRSWRDATAGGSDAAAVIFCQLMVVLFYLPANNQVFAIYDGYTTFAVWLLLWMTGRRQQPAAG